MERSFSGVDVPAPYPGSTLGLVTVVGGTGFVGRALVEALAARGSRIIVAGRDPQRAMRLRPLGDLGQIAPVQADLCNPASLPRIVEGVDVVFNLAGILDEKGGQRFADLHVKGAGALAEAAARAGVRSFIHVSAIGADSQSDSAYGRTKALGEEAVRKAFPTAAIVRPGIVFGADDDFTNRFAALCAKLPIIPVVAGNTRFQPIHVQNLADALVAVMERQLQGKGAETFELGGPQVMTMRDILSYVAKETCREKHMMEVPDAAARLISRFGGLPGAALTQDQYLMLQKDNVAEAGLPGLAELGVQPMPLAAVAPEWLRRYRVGGRFATTA